VLLVFAHHPVVFKAVCILLRNLMEVLSTSLLNATAVRSS